MNDGNNSEAKTSWIKLTQFSYYSIVFLKILSGAVLLLYKMGEYIYKITGTTTVYVPWYTYYYFPPHTNNNAPGSSTMWSTRGALCKTTCIRLFFKKKKSLKNVIENFLDNKKWSLILYFLTDLKTWNKCQLLRKQLYPLFFRASSILIFILAKIHYLPCCVGHFICGTHFVLSRILQQNIYIEFEAKYFILLFSFLLWWLLF